MPTLAELLALVEAVPPIEANTREDGEGTEHDVLHQLELDAIAGLLAFADGAATSIGALGEGLGDAETAITDLQDRVTALESAPGGGAVARALTFGFVGGSGSVDGTLQSVAVGSVFVWRLPWGIELQRWSVLPQGGATGDIELDVQVKPFGSGSFTSITASAAPASTGGANAESDTLTGWTVELAAGDLVQVEITSRTGLVPGVILILEGVQQ
jgi:hypothetical protein